MTAYNLDYLAQLEHEAVFILREVQAQFDRPALLFSGGKDSLVLAHLTRKAFAPAPMPFPLLHIDTGHNFPETLTFRDRFTSRTGARLLVRSVEDSIRAGRVREESGRDSSRNSLQTVTLLDAIAELRLDACIGGARRDEEKSRAKERFFSHRDGFGQWDPRNQRPELWNLFNTRLPVGDHFRVFPLSNWTEMDVWRYIEREHIELPDLYFAHERVVVERNGMIIAHSPYITLRPGEFASTQKVRFRTVGDMTCTGAMHSSAETLAAVIVEVAACRITERGFRMDDRRSETALEDRKRAGYF